MNKSVNKSQDDDILLAALREALAAREAVPVSFVEAAKSAYAWHNIDAELARLAYDSWQDAEAGAALRSESASIRALTFQSALFSIEVEITDDALLGQLVPVQRGMVELQTLAGQTMIAPVDDVGRFIIEPRPGSPFRLRCHTETQADVLTGWVTL